MAYENVIGIESAKERFMGNYQMFSKYLYQFPDRSLFAELKEKIEAQDVTGAFETAHTMKGIVANLSLIQIEEQLIPFVEVLRGGDMPAEEDWNRLEEAYSATVATIDTIQKEGVSLF